MYYIFTFYNIWQDNLIVSIEHVWHFGFVLLNNNTDIL